MQQVVQVVRGLFLAGWIMPALVVGADSDIDEVALQIARTGYYPKSIKEQVSPERLERFFEKEDGGFRVRKELRELVVLVLFVFPCEYQIIRIIVVIYPLDKFDDLS